MAERNGYRVDSNREVLAYGLGNLISALTGCTPINGSVSRSNIAEQYGAKSQVMSVSAGITMLVILMFFTPLIKYLPVCVLTAIVISALLSILELDMAARLLRTDRFEFMVFLFAFLGVVLFGTIYGVVVGVLLSFVTVIVRASNPPMYETGCIPGQYGFYSMERTRNARRIKNVLIFNFSGPLFFANIDAFSENLRKRTREDTRHVIIDSSGITSVDITATKKLVRIYEAYRDAGIDFVLAGHPGTVNDMLRAYGGEILINENAVKRTRTLALRDMGITEPYELEIEEGYDLREKIILENDRMEDLEWAYGSDADEKMREIARTIAEDVARKDRFDSEETLKTEREMSRGHWSSLYENEILDMVDTRLAAMETDRFDFERIEREIEHRRHQVERQLEIADPAALEKLQENRKKLMEDFRKENPEAYRRLEREKRKLENSENTSRYNRAKVIRQLGGNPQERHSDR